MAPSNKRDASRGRLPEKKNAADTARSSKTDAPFSSKPKPSTTTAKKSQKASARARDEELEAEIMKIDDSGVEKSSQDVEQSGSEDEDEESGEKPQHTIPPKLLTRLLREFFQENQTRITRHANVAAHKYMELFIQEAICRAGAERKGAAFLEVEDLEKIAPQLLLDL